MDVTSEDEFIRTCVGYNGQRDLYAGYNERAAGGRDANSVFVLNNAVIDLDPPKDKRLHPSGTVEAIQVAERLAAFVYHSGIHENPVVGCSGNGAYLWLSLEPRLLGNEENRVRMRGAFQKFASFIREQVDGMGTDVKFDSQCTTDFARIIRVIGSTNLKGNREADPDKPKQLDDYWCRDGFFTTKPDRVESTKFWTFLEGLEANYVGKQAKAAWVLPAAPPEIVNWLYYGCPRMRGLAGRGDGIGSMDELQDYATWLYFGANLVKVAGAVGGEEWERVSKMAPGYNPNDWDAANPTNKINEVMRFSGPPRCEMLGCSIAGNPKCPKSPAGWAARHPDALRIVGGRVDCPVYTDYQGMKELSYTYHRMAGMTGDDFSHSLAVDCDEKAQEIRFRTLHPENANAQIEPQTEG